MIQVETFGEYQGARVDQFTLRSATGVEVDLINWGVVVRDWRVPVRGQLRSVVLGFDTFDSYPVHSPYFGALVGRVVSRIRGANFELDGRVYTLVANEGANSLHGGPEGLGRVVWEAEPDETTNSVTFTLVSPDGAMGYPGTLHLKATYRLEGNRLRLEIGATGDCPTPVSLAQHQNFNLGPDDHVLDHRFWFASGAYTELDAELIPTGNILVAAPGSKWDFRAGKTLRDGEGRPISYDGNLVVDTRRDLADPVAIVTAPDRSLTFRLRTDRPGLQFYNGVVTSVPVPGLGGRRYGKYSCFVIEDQALPDALHHNHFPSIIVSPGQPYTHWSEIEIGQ